MMIACQCGIGVKCVGYVVFWHSASFCALSSVLTRGQPCTKCEQCGACSGVKSVSKREGRALSVELAAYHKPIRNKSKHLHLTLVAFMRLRVTSTPSQSPSFT